VCAVHRLIGHDDSRRRLTVRANADTGEFVDFRLDLADLGEDYVDITSALLRPAMGAAVTNYI
jgi:hypothetical protein